MHDTETLNTLLAKAAQDWTDADRLAIIEALRTQRERWNAEQSVGSRKRVPSTKVRTKTASRDLAFEGLKL